ncbi:multidrug ABC transporter permease [Lentzea sp. NBRC 105346]|nr:multidrug ABC transporter permease [Lentzea sp. NBRC 105346]
MRRDTPLIGVEKLKTPKWAAVTEQVADATFRQALRELPTVFRVVTGLAWRASRRLTLLAAVVHVASGCVTAFGLLATADVFTALLKDSPTPERLLASLPAIALVVASYATRALLDAAVGSVEGALRPLVTRAADDAVTAAVVKTELLAFEDADFRELIRRGGRDGVEYIDGCVRWIADLVASLIALGAALVTAGLLNPWLTLALLLTAVGDGWAAARVGRLHRKHWLEGVTRHMRKGVIEDVAMSREYALERHALTLQERLLDEHRRVTESLMADEIRLAHRSNFIRLVGRAAGGLGSGLAYGVLGLLLYSGQLPLALAGTAVLAMRTASQSLSNTMRSVDLLHEGSFHIEFYKTLLAECARRRQPSSSVQAPVDPAEIRLSGVSFTYPAADKPAVQGLDLVVRRGEVIALVGENGSGKTTLGKLLTGLYQPTTGTVTWDGVDLALADPHSVHDQIAVIAQDPAGWPMTAEHNVVVGRLDRDSVEAWRAALTLSSADEVVDSLPMKEKTLLSKRFQDGQDLSGGQWQRLGIARGIYRDAHVLVADEPTAALDAKAEARVFTGLKHASRNTTILVTHRLANIKNADRIVVLAEGKIVEQGTHAELHAARGTYHELYEIQAAAFRG